MNYSSAACAASICLLNLQRRGEGGVGGGGGGGSGGGGGGSPGKVFTLIHTEASLSAERPPPLGEWGGGGGGATDAIGIKRGRLAVVCFV